MPFKMSWEQPHAQLTLPEEVIDAMIREYSSEATINSAKILSGGCANLNLVFSDGNIQKVLRVYMQDPLACSREKALSDLLCDTLPVARFFHTGIVGNHHYAIMEFKPGEPLSHILTREPDSVTAPLFYKVGEMLAKLSSHKFHSAGFFTGDLVVKQPIEKNGYFNCLSKLLNHPHNCQHLGMTLTQSLSESCHQFASLLPDCSSKQLVHGDFNPANILIAKTKDGYEISALLDFEHSFSGSNLCDVASMLRFSHTLSWSLQQAFIAGIETKRTTLPENWRSSIKLLNCLSLLDCLQRTDPVSAPSRLNSIKNSLQRLDQQLKALEPMPNKKTLDKAMELLDVSNLQFVRKMENIVYSCKHKGETTFLRLTSKKRRSYHAITNESLFLSALNQKNVPTVQLLNLRNLCESNPEGERANTVDMAHLCKGDTSEAADLQYTACLFGQVSGTHPSPETMQDLHFATQLGELIAEMHNSSFTPPPSNNHREMFKEERGMRYAMKAAEYTKHHAFKKKFEMLIEWAESQGQDPSIFGLIHADLGASNLFLYDGKIIPIDFDDCFYFLFAFDYVIPICSTMIENQRILSRQEEKSYIDALQKGYCRKRAFSQNQRESIPKLIQLACLRLFFWIEQHTYLDTFDPRAWNHVARVQSLATQYLNDRLDEKL